MDFDYRFLKVINEIEGITQRDIAEELDLSIGKVNSSIKELIDEEIIFIEKISRKPYYRLTSKGFHMLEDHIAKNKNDRINLHEMKFKRINQAVILAAGNNANFDKPVGFLNLEDITIFKRTCSILRENGIEKIIVVTGYRSEYYEQISKELDLVLVKNTRYKWTGTMSSLALVKEYIDDDFILVENDLVFEERAIIEVLNKKVRDCILITNESGSKDEAFVEIRDGHMFKISKDIHMLHKVDGEMIGISKLSYELFQRMLQDFEIYNKNPYLNYEYALLDVGRNISIDYVKIDDLVWAEIDNKEHHENVINYVYPRLKRKEIEIKTLKLRQHLIDILDITADQVGEIVPAGGMTNKNYKVSIGNKNYILRVPGAGTEEMINRFEEKSNSRLANELRLDTEILYFDEISGIKISEFIENAETLNATTAKREGNMKLTSSILKKLHDSGIIFENTFNVFEKIEHYENLLKKAQGKSFEDYFKIKRKVMYLEEILKELDVELKSCHNDCVPENFVKGDNERIFLIDWEYSGMNDPMWDIAAHSIECDFSEDDEELYLQHYFGHTPEEKYLKRILIYKICQDFLWSTWTNIKEAKGDDFGTYGIDRYNRAKSNLRKIFNE
jgi:thiamine kinase-like enzyme/choline kinase/predicted transcriptional regulator